MSEASNDRRRPRSLSAETKWEIFLQITAGEISQAEAARKWRVDVSTVIGIRRTVKDAALAALARKPGRPGTQRDWQLEAARAEITQLTEAVKAQAIELAIVRGKSGWGLSGPVPARVPAEVKELVLEDGRRRGRRRVRPHLGLLVVAGLRLPGAPLAAPMPRHRHPGRPRTRRAADARAAARGDRGDPRRRRTLG
jgi:hypothetical protein